MAKDDYFKIVFMILEYLYKCLREGESYIGIERVKAYAITDDIPLEYFNNIVQDMLDEGYMKAITETVEYVHQSKKENIKALKISMRGVEFFNNNTTMKQVAKFLKEFKDVTPGL